VAAIRASQLGLKAAVVEREYMGGVCLNVGCIPSKSLLKNAEVAHTLRKRGKELGFSFDNLNLDYSAAVKRSRRVSKRLTKGVDFLMRKNKIDVGNTTELNAKDIVIATGSSPAHLPGIEVDGENVITYREAILQEKLPESMMIIGAGALGVEFATVWNSYGVPVTLVEILPRMVPNEDEEVSAELAKAFKRNGITVMTDSRVTAVDISGGMVKATVAGKDGDQVVEVDQILVAASFKPNIAGLGLEEMGVKLTERGAVDIDDRMGTNVEGIWAIGDVTAKLMLAHAASAMGVVCAENIAGKGSVTLDFERMPKATYCHPQLASFGMTEAQAVERGYEIKVGRFNFQANGKALGLGDYGGWVKIITDAKYGEILGAHMIGPEVTELLPELTLAQMMELTPDEIGRNIHAHPTLSEVLMEAAHAVDGKAIHA
jgi:dihydrolipoamide dehydrogenase